MKIRHPLAIKAVGWAVACLVRLWVGTLRYRYRPAAANVDPNRRDLPERYLYCFWHGDLLAPAQHYSGNGVAVLISGHADGRLVAEACRHLRYKVVTGSTTRGGVEALRGMLRRGRDAHLVITPDGPRGPRRRVQPGAVYVAARTGLPIVPVALAYSRAWRMDSWDRFALPWPFSAVTCVTGEVIRVPAGAGRADLEGYRLQLERAMERAQAAAERWAARDGW